MLAMAAQGRILRHFQTQTTITHMSDYQFKAISLNGAKTINNDPVAASVHGTPHKILTIRLMHNVVKRCGFSDKSVLTPFVDMEKRTVLLLHGLRPLPRASRVLQIMTQSKTPPARVQFPYRDEFVDLFEVAPMRGMILREASAGRLVFSVPRLKS